MTLFKDISGNKKKQYSKFQDLKMSQSTIRQQSKPICHSKSSHTILFVRTMQYVKKDLRVF